VKSIATQAHARADRWPTLELQKLEGRRAQWVGDVTPHQRRYRIEITYKAPLAVERFTAAQVQPRVRVLHPDLEEHSDYELGPLPHVYWTSGGPVLCLFDPDQGEWSSDDLLAETTVPWALRWLVFYEGWLATKKWKGGGRDHDRDTGQRLGKASAPVRRRERWFASAATLA
jgi:hypothetical protein